MGLYGKCRYIIRTPNKPYSVILTMISDFSERKEYHHNLTTETLIASPNYPFYYGDNYDYTWDVHIPNAVAIKVDILDIHLPARKVREIFFFLED